MEWINTLILGLIFSLLFFEKSKGLTIVEKGQYFAKVICLLLGMAVYLGILFYVIVVLGFRMLDWKLPEL